jgi:hypothetical protein
MGRRSFLLAAGAAGATGGVLLGACGGGGGGDELTEEERTGITRLDRLEGDLAIAALVHSLENLAIATYTAARDRMEEGRLGDLPPAMVRYIETAQRQHEEHARAWNGIVTGAGRPGVTGVDLTLKTQLEPGVNRARDHVAIGNVFLELESITAATYLAAIGAIENNAALKVAASIQPVETQHVAIVSFMLGRTPVPESFAKADGARPTTDTIG